jgi:hypothetical protein
MAGDGAMRARWNTALLRDVATPCYARVLAQAAAAVPLPKAPAANKGATTAAAAATEQAVGRYQRLFPTEPCPAPWDVVATALYRAVADQPVLFTTASGGQWVAPKNAVLLHDGIVGGRRGGTMGEAEASTVAGLGLPPAVASLLPHGQSPADLLANALLADGLPLARVGAALARALLASGAVPTDRVATPPFVRGHFRAAAASAAGRAASGKSGGGDGFLSLAQPATLLWGPLPDISTDTATSAAATGPSMELLSEAQSRAPSALVAASPRSAAHVVALVLLEHCLMSVAAKDVGAELAGLPLLPLADGTLGTLRAKVAVDATVLGELQAMGFR